MKAKLKLFSLILIVLLAIIDSVLLVNNIKGKDYNNINSNRSTANYLKIPEMIKDILSTPPIVYDGMTLTELSDKLNRSLNSTIFGKGELIASYSLEVGVDPYLATAIILHETGCKWDCSYLVNACNNVGGQKGSGCGSYSYFESLDEGIKKFIDNLYNNYIVFGLNTAELINAKYAESKSWSQNVNKYIQMIKAQ